MLAENSPEFFLEPVPYALNDTGRETTSPLSKAARRGRLRVITWLIDHALQTGRDIQDELGLAFRDAVYVGKNASCELLLRKGAKLKSADGLLVRAIQQNFDQLAEWLIDRGADINTIGTGQLTAMDGRTVEITSRYTNERRKMPVTASFWMSPLG